MQIFSNSKTDALAAFTEVTYNVTDQLTAIAGLRYSYENREYDGAFADISLPEIGKTSFNAVTPRFSLSYEYSPRTNIYFTYSEGFKSGLFDTSSFTDTVIKPETAKGYEIGFKTVPSAEFAFNAAIFYTEVSDRQVQAADPSTGRILLANAASAEVFGAEFDATWYPTPDFMVRLSTSYLPTADYKDYKNASVVIPDTVNGGATGGVVDLSGKRLQKAQEVQSTLLLNYQTQLAWGYIDASTNISYSSAFHYDNGGYIKQDPYTMINASLSWSPSADAGYKLGVFVKNLANEEVYQSYLSPLNVTYMAPREIGVSADYSF